MKKSKTFLFLLFFLIFGHSFSQTKQVIKCKIMSVEKAFAYYVIRVKLDSSTKLMTVLSYINDSIPINEMNRFCKIEIEKDYTLTIRNINTFYVDKNKKVPMFFPDKSLYDNGVFFSSPGIYPKLALNLKGLYYIPPR